MKQRVFEDKHRDFWKVLEDLFNKKIKRDVELNDNFPSMYRSLCKQLAVARGRNYSPILIQYLEELVASGHQRLYGRRGGAEMKIKELLRLGEGSVVELDRLAGDPLDILANGTMIAKGEVVMVGERYGVRFTEIVDPEKRMESV